MAKLNKQVWPELSLGPINTSNPLLQLAHAADEAWKFLEEQGIPTASAAKIQTIIQRLNRRIDNATSLSELETLENLIAVNSKRKRINEPVEVKVEESDEEPPPLKLLRTGKMARYAIGEKSNGY